MPSGSAATGAFSTLVSRKSSSSSSTRSLSSLRGRKQRARIEHVAPQPLSGPPGPDGPASRCSRTVSPMKSSGCWNVRARPFLARARHDALVTSSPCRCTSPAVGSQEARQDGEQRRFSGTVGPDQAGDAPRLDLEAHRQTAR